MKNKTEKVKKNNNNKIILCQQEISLFIRLKREMFSLILLSFLIQLE